MELLTIIGIAIGLSFDTFAVSLSCGMVQSRIIFREALKIAFIFALFQGGLTVAGYFLGTFVSQMLKSLDHWVALILLSFLGIKMIVEGRKCEKETNSVDYTSAKILLTMAVGTSIDAFAVGISFALLEMKIWLSGFVIGTVTFLASMTAIRIGKSAGNRLGKRVEIAGGLILIAIGIKIFLDHMLG